MEKLNVQLFHRVEHLSSLPTREELGNRFVSSSRKQVTIMTSKTYYAFNDDKGDKKGKEDSSIEENTITEENIMGSFAATQSPSSTSSKGSSASRSSGNNILSQITKIFKTTKEPNIQSGGVVNYGGDHDSESISTLSTGPNQLGYSLPFNLKSGNSDTKFNDKIDDDESSQRTPIPKVLPSSALNAILPSDFLRARVASEENMSDLSEDDSIIKRQKREAENVGRLVHAAKQQQSFAQAWFSAGQAQNALPPIPPKKQIPSNVPPSMKKTSFSESAKSSGPIDLDSGEPWEADNQSTSDHSKMNWEVGSFNFTTHSAPTKKRGNKSSGVPDDEDLTAYYIPNKWLEKIVCVIGGNNCTLLGVLVFGFIILLLSGGAIAAGIIFASRGENPSAAPSVSPQPTTSISPSMAPIRIPTIMPTFLPTTAPSSQPSLRSSNAPSLEPTSQPSTIPSSMPSSIPSLQPSLQPTSTAQPSSSPSSQPSRCFPSVTYQSLGQIQRLSDGFRDDLHGYAVSLSQDGSVVAISATNFPEGGGSVSIYSQSLNNQLVPWTQKGQTIEGESGFGNSIELSNDGLTVVIGSSAAEFIGLARVFRYNAIDNIWEQLGSDIFQFDSLLAGISVSISGDGNVVAVGDSEYDFGYGRVVIYDFDGTDWIIRGDPIVGQSFLGEFGHSISLSQNGSIVVCGAPRGGSADNNISINGSVHIFEWNSSVLRWDNLGQDIINTDDSPPRFGDKVSLADNENILRIAIGSPLRTVETNTNSGSVSVWEYNSVKGVWMQLGSDMNGAPANNQMFGTSISMARDGTHVAVGLPLYGNGQTYVYFWNGDIWDTKEPLSGNDLASKFGHDVALSKDGNTLVVGAASDISSGYWQAFRANKDC